MPQIATHPAKYLSKNREFQPFGTAFSKKSGDSVRNPRGYIGGFSYSEWVRWGMTVD